jgi:Ca-activated chloride channel family protein
MPYDPNDPRLTAYALGELEPADQAEIEAQLETCAESRAAVEEIRAAARMLEDELRCETSPGLAPEQRSAIELHLAHPPRTFAPAWLKLALAAGVLICGGLAFRDAWQPKAANRIALARAERAGEPAAASPAPKARDLSAPRASAASAAPEAPPAAPSEVTDFDALAAQPAPSRPAESQARRSLAGEPGAGGFAYRAKGMAPAAEQMPPGTAPSESKPRGGEPANRTQDPTLRGRSRGLGEALAQRTGPGAKPMSPESLTRGQGQDRAPSHFGLDSGVREQAPQGLGVDGLAERGAARSGKAASPAKESMLGGRERAESESSKLPQLSKGPQLEQKRDEARAQNGNGQAALSSRAENKPNQATMLSISPTAPAYNDPLGSKSAAAGRSAPGDVRLYDRSGGMAGGMGGMGGGMGGGGGAMGRDLRAGAVPTGRPGAPPAGPMTAGKPAAGAETLASGVPSSNLARKSTDAPTPPPPGQAPAAAAPDKGKPAVEFFALADESKDANAKKDTVKQLKEVKDGEKAEGLVEERRAQEREAEQLAVKARVAADPNTEEFRRIIENPFLRTVGNELSTFSIDVDTASYSIIRRYLNQSQWPPADSARIEELINYFPYDYPLPKGDVPFSINVDIARCPWSADHRLARIGLKGKDIPRSERPRSNLVFLVDVSGSMDAPDKLPLVKAGLMMLVDQLTENDRVAIVVYASRTGVELASVDGSRKDEIRAAIDRLNPGGSTNGGAGIVLAYEQAVSRFMPNGTNRVILCTDGDFNVGVSSEGELTRLIESKAKESKVLLSVLGFGQGNLKDGKMETLADKGNGNYAYIDTFGEARKVLVDQMMGTLNTIAKDVKIQVDFNAAHVGAYRLIGYENRMLRAEDFNNDAKDAGEIGAGHTVTALYELVPPDKVDAVPGFEKSKYAKPTGKEGNPESKESLTVRLKYKAPDKDKSEAKIEVGAVDDGREYPENPTDYRFAAAVAEFGLLLHGSPYKGNATYAGARELAESGRGKDEFGYRAEFIEILKKAEGLPK